MASVFLSYDRDDTERARLVAAALEHDSHEVWWDQHIRAGAQFSKQIEEALERADAVVVLWSKNSIESAWVRDEAAAGRDSGRLVPVTIDGTQPPLGFRQFQTIDLARMKGRDAARGLAQLLAAIAATGSDELLMNAVAPPKTIRRLGARHVALIAILMVMSIGSLLAWRMYRTEPDVPTLAVVAADQNAASGALARDLLIKLGALPSATAGNLRLIGKTGEAGGHDPTLTFEISDHSSGETAQVNLALIASRDGSLIWSSTFEESNSNRADLQQQMAYTAARILACAREAWADDRQKVGSQLLKDYLTGCESLNAVAESSGSPAIPAMIAILQDYPKFSPAWATLLIAETEAVRPEANDGGVDPRAIQRLRQHIAAARKVNPDLPELALAEIALLPRRDYVQAIAIIDKAKSDHPDNPVVLSFRAGLMASVGRMREAIRDARRAAELDPISPYAQNGLIFALSYAGKIDEAKAELQRAEELWPGTKSLKDAQYRFHLRFGDPKIALASVEVEDRGRGVDAYLRTRLDPSPENVQQLVDYVRERIKTVRRNGLAHMIQAYGEFGQIDELYGELLNWQPEEDLAIVSDVYFRPGVKQARNDPRFMKLAQRAGLLTYWIKSGQWPDFCSEPDLPYDCKAEAAKLH